MALLAIPAYACIFFLSLYIVRWAVEHGPNAEIEKNILTSDEEELQTEWMTRFRIECGDPAQYKDDWIVRNDNHSSC